MKLYLDSDVWITLFDKRDVRHAIVVELFEKIRSESITLIISPIHFTEIERTGYLKGLQERIRELKVEKIESTTQARASARELNRKLGSGYVDCLHVMTALENSAVPVSYDHHWEEIGRTLGAKVFMPGELLKN